MNKSEILIVAMLAISEARAAYERAQKRGQRRAIFTGVLVSLNFVLLSIIIFGVFYGH